MSDIDIDSLAEQFAVRVARHGELSRQWTDAFSQLSFEVQTEVVRRVAEIAREIAEAAQEELNRIEETLRLRG